MSDYGRPLVCRPAYDIAPNAVWSLTAGSANADYPVSNLGNRNPAKPFKATGTSFTARATFGSPETIVGVMLGNHNFAGASVSITSGTGMNETITIPANSSDGLCIDPGLDLVAAGATSSERTSTTFDIVVTGVTLASFAGLGEVMLLAELEGLNLKWGVKYQPTRLQIKHRTWGGSHLQYDKKIRIRTITGMLDLRDDEAFIRELEMQAIGGYHPFVVQPDEDVNDWIYGQLVPGSFSYSLSNYSVTQMPFEFQEVSKGPPLF